MQPTPMHGGGGTNSGNRRSGLGGKLAAGGIGLAGGTLLGGKISFNDTSKRYWTIFWQGALGYAAGGGFNRHNGWSYGMGPPMNYGGYG